MVRERCGVNGVITRDGVLDKITELQGMKLLRLLARDDYFLTGAIDKLTGGSYANFVMTYRNPWDRHITIAYPAWMHHVSAWKVFAHELVHYYQFQSEFGWAGMARRYLTDRGRLEIEAPAYALSHALGDVPLDHATASLHRAYDIDDLCDGIPRCSLDAEIGDAIAYHSRSLAT
jgi:hypothetical protein